MVFKADFVEDLGGPKEVAAVDPKMAYYLADTLRQKEAAIGNIVKATAQGVIDIDSHYQTSKLSENMKQTRDELEEGIKKETAIKSAKAQFDWEMDAEKQMNPYLSKEEQDKMTSAFKDKLQTIEGAFTQKNIGYGEAVYRWNKALQEAIAARPSLAQEFRGISGKWTGSGDWDHFYIKQEASRLESEQAAAKAAAVKMEQRMYDKEQENIKWVVSHIGVSPEDAERMRADPKGRMFIQQQVQMSMTTEAAKKQAEYFKAQGTLGAETLRPAYNSVIAQATIDLVGRHATALTTMQSTPMAKYSKGGEFDYLAASQDTEALTWLKNSILEDIGKSKTGIATWVAGMVKGTNIDPSTFYKENDDWGKRITDMLEQSPTAALDMIKVMRDGKHQNFTDAVAIVGAMNNVYRNLGINSTILEEYNRVGKDVFAKKYPGISVDMLVRYEQLNKQSMGLVGAYATDFGLTMQQLGDGTLPPMEPTEMTQAQADAIILANQEMLAALNNGTLNPKDTKVYNTVFKLLNFTKPVGANWEGKDRLLSAITSGKFGKFISGLTTEQAIAVKDTFTTNFTTFLKDFDKSNTGKDVMQKALGGADYAERFIVTRTDTQASADEFGISIPKYKISLTEKGKAELNKKNVANVYSAGPGAVFLSGKDKNQETEQEYVTRMTDLLNKNMSKAFERPYVTGANALRIVQTIPNGSGPSAKPVTENVPKNTSPAKKGTYRDASPELQEYMQVPEVVQNERNKVQVDVLMQELSDVQKEIALTNRSLEIAKKNHPDDEEYIKDLSDKLDRAKKNSLSIQGELKRFNK